MQTRLGLDYWFEKPTSIAFKVFFYCSAIKLRIISSFNHNFWVLLRFVDNDLTGRIVYSMFFLGRTFVSCILCTLKRKRTGKNTLYIKTFSALVVCLEGYSRSWCKLVTTKPSDIASEEDARHDVPWIRRRAASLRFGGSNLLHLVALQ